MIVLSSISFERILYSVVYWRDARKREACFLSVGLHTGVSTIEIGAENSQKATHISTI